MRPTWRLQVKRRTGEWEDVLKPGSKKPLECTSEDKALKVLARCFAEQVYSFIFLGGEQTVRVQQTG